MHPSDLLPLLGSLQLADSAFPSGLYALSHGLEAFHQARMVDAESLEPIIADLLRFGAGPADGVALVNAHRAAEEHDARRAADGDLRLTATKLTREIRAASVRTGKQVLGLANSLFRHPILAGHAERVQTGELPGNHAVAMGLATAALGIGREQALAAHLYSFCSGCAGAAVRLAIIDYRQAQRLLHALKPAIADAVCENIDKDVPEIASNLPLADIMAMRHERAEVRLFVT